MNREQANENISSELADTRLKAARYFARYATPDDRKKIQLALRSETVPWIKLALARALEQCGGTTTLLKIHDSGIDKESESLMLIRDMRASAVEEVAGTIIHEFSAVVGMIRLSAKDEVPNYTSSLTHKNLERLNALMLAVRKLKSAAAVPTYTQFDLSATINDVIDGLGGAIDSVKLSLAGPQDFLVTADEPAMKLALVNGIKNALEAVIESSHVDPPELLLNWGYGGDQNWFVLIDSGPGFSGDPALALKLGATNKKDHIGYGLATAQYAMVSMEGEIILSNNPAGGARFELRWYRDNENIIG